MKKSLLLITTVLVILGSCNSSSKKEKSVEENETRTEQRNAKGDQPNDDTSGNEDGDQATPEDVVKSIFKAAKTGDFSNLTNLCDPRGDGDSKMICEINSATTEKQEEFQAYFSKGRIIGEAEVEGDEAKVNIKFGPNGDRNETINLRKTGHQWYLISF